MSGGGGTPGESAEIDRLATVANEANIVTSIVELRGQFAQFFDRETRAYYAAAGSAASDEGLAEHIARRTEEMRGCWAADVDAILTGRAAR